MLEILGQPLLSFVRRFPLWDVENVLDLRIGNKYVLWASSCVLCREAVPT